MIWLLTATKSFARLVAISKHSGRSSPIPKKIVFFGAHWGSQQRPIMFVMFGLWVRDFK
jgi:hypothetical protein